MHNNVQFALETKRPLWQMHQTRTIFYMELKYTVKSFLGASLLWFFAVNTCTYLPQTGAEVHMLFCPGLRRQRKGERESLLELQGLSSFSVFLPKCSSCYDPTTSIGGGRTTNLLLVNWHHHVVLDVFPRKVDFLGKKQKDMMDALKH